MKHLLFTICFACSLTCFAQWEPLGYMYPFSANAVVAHQGKAYALVEGRLCAGDLESSERYAFYPVDAATGLRFICSWGNYFVTASSNSVTVYSDVATGRKLISKTLSPGTISSLAVKDSLLFVGNYQGIYKSSDTLQHLELSSSGTSIRNVSDLEAGKNSLLAATDSGVHISVNNGETWQRISAKSKITSIASYSDTLYAGTANGLYWSSDTGKAWTKSAFFADRTIKRLSGDKEHLYIYTSAELYRKTVGKVAEMQLKGLAGQYQEVLGLGKVTLVASSWGMVFSEDETSWTSVLTGLKSNQLRSFTSLATNGKAILSGSDGSGAYLSNDQGKTWIMRSPPFHYDAVLSTRSTFYNDNYWFISTYQTIYRSADEGKSWSKIHNGLPATLAANCFLKANDRLWLGSSQGIFYSTDMGDHWLRPDSGISLSIQRILQVKNGKLMAFSSDTLYTSLPPYAVWKAENLTTTFGFSAAAQNGDTLYVGSSGDGIFRSFDGGGTWQLLTKGITQGSISHLVVSPDYALATDGMGNIFIRTHSDTSWTNFTGSIPYAVQGLMLKDDTVYATVQFERLFRRSLNDYQSPLALENAADFQETPAFYPNPATESLTFRNSTAILSIELCDMTGNRLLLSGPVEKLLLTGIPPGIYLVKTRFTNANLATRKLVIR